MLSHFTQKILIFLLWLFVNVTLIVTSILYSDYWYIFIVILSLSSVFNCLSVILIVFVRIKNLFFKPRKGEKTEYSKRSLGFVVPCYNESEEELKCTFESIKSQRDIEENKKMLFVICDGRVKGKDCDLTTDHILKKMLKEQTTDSFYFKDAYKTWTGETNNIELFIGKMDNIPFIVFIKDNNVGKRDSLVLIRSLLYNYSNNIINNDWSNEFRSFTENYIKNAEIEIFDYLVGTDADTVFDNECTFNLLKEIDWDEKTHGVVGFVHVSPRMPKWSLWTIYQFTEYIIAQCLRRVQQSIVTNKVSCLSGCVQILRVSKETSGNEILKAFNSCPDKDANVWRHILSFASEDRNHVCLMLHMYPYVKTRQSLSAKAYTTVPDTLEIFRSQRRRWSLGATSNDILLCYKSGINFYERIGAIFNVFTYSLSLFIFAATIMFYYSIIAHPNIMMLYLSSIIFIPILYEICILLWFPFDNITDIFRFLFGLVIYLVFGSIINIMIGVYSILNVDCFKWGKTRISNKEIGEVREVVIEV